MGLIDVGVVNSLRIGNSTFIHSCKPGSQAKMGVVYFFINGSYVNAAI